MGGARGRGTAPAAPSGQSATPPAAPQTRVGGAWQGRHFVTPPAGITTFTPNTFGSPHGFGNVVFPGTGHAPGTFTPFSTVGGFGRPLGFSRFNRGATTVVLPYAVPVYIPYAEPAPPPPPPPPQIIYIVPSGTPYAPLPAPEGVTTYVVPRRENSATESSAAPAKRSYLIALKSSSIYAATDYWVQGDTLHYITTSGAHNQVSLDQVDQDFTTQLNRERGLDFRWDK